MWLARLKNAVLMSYHPMNVQLFEVFQNLYMCCLDDHGTVTALAFIY